MRDEHAPRARRTELWDTRVAVLQVTDAVGGYVRVRILVTAADAPTLFDLRCYLREELVAWLHDSSPQSIPRQRVQLVEAEAATRRTPRAAVRGRAATARCSPARTRPTPPAAPGSPARSAPWTRPSWSARRGRQRMPRGDNS